jgi:uncharacterized protein
MVASLLLEWLVVPHEQLGTEAFLMSSYLVSSSLRLLSLVLLPWALWHLPLWLTGAPGRTASLYAAFVVSVIALSVILTWVYNSTGGAS